jgi:hypothetical protein
VEVITMSKTILRKVPDEDMYYNFEDEVEIDTSKVVICGNRNYREFGDETLIDIIEGNYYDDIDGYDYEVLDKLKKVTGKEWVRDEVIGYSQGDWNLIYYVKDEVSQEQLDEIENFYMGKVSEFTVVEEDDEESIYHVYVPDSIVWKGKKSICDYLGLDINTTTVYEDDGYERVIKYKEIN